MLGPIVLRAAVHRLAVYSVVVLTVVVSTLVAPSRPVGCVRCRVDVAENSALCSIPIVVRHGTPLLVQAALTAGPLPSFASRVPLTRYRAHVRRGRRLAT